MSRLPARLVRLVAKSPLIAAAVASAPLAPAQEILRQWLGDAANQQFGGPIAWVGDVNADGFVDIGIAAPNDSTVNAQGGMVRVVSGADGSVLYNFYGDLAGARLGNLGQPLGDVDLDGHDDILVSEPNVWIGNAEVGRVFVFSGRDGSVLRKIKGTATQLLSGPVCGTGDIDGDGVPDFAVGGDYANSVSLFSGATGAVIRTLQATDPASTAFGHGLLNPGDIDGDGVADLIVVENSCSYSNDMNDYAFSGRTGAILWKVRTYTYCYRGSGSSALTGLSPTVVGDLDGDGINDWALGTNISAMSGGTYGYISCYSGKDGSTILRSDGGHPSGHGGSTFGKVIAPAGDVNGDGVPDFAASDYRWSEDPGGEVYFVSGVDGKVLFHCHGLPSATGFGTGLAAGIDSDHDGRLDVFVGDIWDGTSGSYAGAVTQMHLEPIELDAAGRYDPWGSTTISVNGGIPGNPLGIFLVGVNGVLMFDLVQVDTFDGARRSQNTWFVPLGITGVTAKFVAYTFDGSGHLQASNLETILFP